MADYLLIESRDPFESNDVLYYYDLAQSLAQKGDRVALFLVQNGVLPARAGKYSGLLTGLANSGVELLADEFSLRERGIGSDKIIAKVSASALEVVIDRMADGWKTIWH